ncbi:MAG: DUF697 domain-containing protein [Spirulinaceae cyanobacterium]
MRRPILVGGVSLSLGLWLWQSWHESIMQVGEFGLVGAIALGTGFWLWKQKSSFSSSVSVSEVLSPVDQETVEAAIATAEKTIDYLESEADSFAVEALRVKLNQLPELLHREVLQVAIAGGKKVGKSSLQAILGAGEEEDIIWQEIPVEEKVPVAADLVLYLTGGDITDSELKVLQKLSGNRYGILLLLNKQDCYLPEEGMAIIQQLRRRIEGVLVKENVLGIAAAPGDVKVRQHQEDGAVEEWWEPQQPDIEGLHFPLQQLLKEEKEQLVWATTWRQAMALQEEAKEVINNLRRDRALPIMEKYQWVAAAAAFANPVPALDMLATAAINAQLVVDLGAIYQQKFSLAQAQNAAGTLGKLMVQLGLVELSTQTIGSILKSHGLTYVAGGAVQGVSAAYLTRLAGLSLMAYFQEQQLDSSCGEGFNFAKLGEKLQAVFQSNQRQAFLQGFVKQVMASSL